MNAGNSSLLIRKQARNPENVSQVSGTGRMRLFVIGASGPILRILFNVIQPPRHKAEKRAEHLLSNHTSVPLAIGILSSVAATRDHTFVTNFFIQTLFKSPKWPLLRGLNKHALRKRLRRTLNLSPLGGLVFALQDGMTNQCS